jgi:hypothetical protein
MSRLTSTVGDASMPSSKSMPRHPALRHVKHLKFVDEPSCDGFEVHHSCAPPVLHWPEDRRDEYICRVLETISDDKLESFW